MTDEGGGSDTRRYRRRAVLATVGALAGCASLGGGDSTDGPTTSDGTPPAVSATETPPATTTASTTDGAGTDASTATPTPEVLAAVTGDYPAYRHDAGRRAYTPATAGPPTAPTVGYTLDLPGEVAQPVVSGDRLVLAWRSGEPATPTVATYDVRRSNRLWTVDLEASAVATPVVAGDRVVVQTDRGTRALDDEGGVAWRSQAVTAGEFTPAVVGDRVYAVGPRGMAALGAGGTQSWTIPLGAAPLAPVAADGDTVYLLVPRDMTTMGLLALDAADGTTAWRRAVEARSGFPPARAGDAVYVTSDRRQGGVTALATDTGDRLWRADVRLDRGTAVTENRLVVARGSRLLGLSRADGTVAWSTDLASDVVTDPVADSETAYVGLERSDGGLLAAVGTASGTIRWTLSLDRPADRVVILEGGLAVTTGEAEAGTRRLHVLLEN